MLPCQFPRRYSAQPRRLPRHVIRMLVLPVNRLPGHLERRIRVVVGQQQIARDSCGASPSNPAASGMLRIGPCRAASSWASACARRVAEPPSVVSAGHEDAIPGCSAHSPAGNDSSGCPVQRPLGASRRLRSPDERTARPPRVCRLTCRGWRASVSTPERAIAGTRDARGSRSPTSRRLLRLRRQSGSPSS